jgi:hypothetical protein
MKLFHNTKYIVFIIMYNHYLSKFLEWKIQVLKLKF